MPEIINKKRFREFCKLLENSSIDEKHKRSLKFAIEFMEGKHELRLATRTFLFNGEPGVGKTFLVKQLLKVFNVPIIVAGCSDVENAIRHDELQDLINEIDKHEQCVIFIDDLSYLFRFNDYVMDEESSEVKQQLMKLTDVVKNSPKRLLLFITANHFSELEESIIDRIEEKIEVEIPGEQNKLAFLEEHYSDIMSHVEMKQLAIHSLGYNYRDLAEIIKIAYRQGNKKIGEGLQQAMKEYIPTALQSLKVIPYCKDNFNSVVGREAIKSKLKHIIMTHKKQAMAESLGLKRHNLLIFEGPAGSGKTLMVQALAGELQMPLIQYSARHFYRAGLSFNLERLKNLCNRFRNAIIVIDEADKLIGKYTLDEEGLEEGHLNELFDGIASSVNSLVIVVINNINRFGEGLKDRFTTISFGYPSYEERVAFYKMKLETLRNKIKCDIDVETIAKLTNDMSFREIEKLWNQALYNYLDNESIGTDTFTKLIRSRERSEMYG